MSKNDLFHLYSNPWGLHLNSNARKDNKYICLSGNSGVGKSTLLKSIGETIFKHDDRTIAVDEKSIHHPFLSSLFFDTQKYGFQIQLNFMIQRSLLINKCLDDGYNLIMERSHFDDRIFMTHLYNEGVINKSEYNTYMQLWEQLLKRTRIPNIMILLNLPLNKAIENVTADELYGRRPKEFPDETKKEKWLSSWHNLYMDFFDEMRKNGHNIKTIEFNENVSIENVVSQITDALDFTSTEARKKDVSNDVKEMFEKAKKAMSNAHNPYSGVAVGACIRSSDGKMYTGCNIENISSSVTLCAEAAAIGNMLSAGSKRISEIVIVSNKNELISPCGACRQRMVEFTDSSVKVHMFNCNGDYETDTFGKLMPRAFKDSTFPDTIPLKTI